MGQGDTGDDLPKSWTAEAAEMVAHLPRNDRLVLRSHVERYATSDRSREITPEWAHIEKQAKIEMLYPSVGDFAYEQHKGPNSWRRLLAVSSEPVSLSERRR